MNVPRVITTFAIPPEAEFRYSMPLDTLYIGVSVLGGMASIVAIAPDMDENGDIKCYPVSFIQYRAGDVVATNEKQLDYIGSYHIHQDVRFVFRRG